MPNGIRVLEDILDAMRNDVLAQREAMQVRVMPGVEETLEHLQAKGAALGVATGNLESIGWLKIELAGLRDWFSFGGFSDRFIVRAEMIGHAAGDGARDCGRGCVSLRSGRYSVRRLGGAGEFPAGDRGGDRALFLR